MSRSLLGSIVLALGVTSAGCSAIVAPDLGRLGGTDAGPGGVDAPGTDAPRTDAGPPGDAGTDAPPPECTTAAMCDDDVDCTTDDCASGRCTHVGNDAACATDERCNVVSGCVPIVCEDDGDCSDGDVCNGNEMCAPGGAGSDPRTGCRAGPSPDCNDGITCTDDVCDPTTGCGHVPDHASCDDDVDCTLDQCGGATGPSGCSNVPNDGMCATDVCTVGASCNATAGCVGGAPRDCLDGNACTADACDPSAAGFCSHVPLDADMDGAPARMAGTAVCAGGTDCNDMNPAVRPGVAEVCGNAIDDNCSGVVDEGCTAPTGDNCATARPLVLTGDPGGARTVRVTAMFSSFVHDYTTMCSASGSMGRDAVYALTLDRLSDVRIETTGVSSGSGSAPDTVLAVGASCDAAAFNGACNDDADPGGAGLGSRIWLHRAGPASAGGSVTVYILVEAYNTATGGTFQLDVTVTPVHGDACGVEQLDITGGGLVIGVSPGLGAVVGSQEGTCDPDIVDTDSEAGVFRLTAPGDGVLSSVSARSASFSPLLYVRRNTCSTGTEVGCTAGGTLNNVGIPGGTTTYVFVDGVPAGTVSSLPYTLTYNP